MFIQNVQVSVYQPYVTKFVCFAYIVPFSPCQVACPIAENGKPNWFDQISCTRWHLGHVDLPGGNTPFGLLCYVACCMSDPNWYHHVRSNEPLKRYTTWWNEHSSSKRVQLHGSPHNPLATPHHNWMPTLSVEHEWVSQIGVCLLVNSYCSRSPSTSCFC